MGADFIFQYVVIKKGTEEEAKKKVLKAIKEFNIPELSKDKKYNKEKILNKLSNDKSENYKQFVEFWEDYGDINDNGEPVEESENKPFNEEVISEGRAKDVMVNIVEEFFGCLGYRDIGCLERNGELIYLTGGMSHGDNPTDSCDTFNQFNLLPQSILKKGDME